MNVREETLRVMYGIPTSSERAAIRREEWIDQRVEQLRQDQDAVLVALQEELSGLELGNAMWHLLTAKHGDAESGVSHVWAYLVPILRRVAESDANLVRYW